MCEFLRFSESRNSTPCDIDRYAFLCVAFARFYRAVAEQSALVRLCKHRLTSLDYQKGFRCFIDRLTDKFSRPCPSENIVAIRRLAHALLWLVIFVTRFTKTINNRFCLLTRCDHFDKPAYFLNFVFRTFARASIFGKAEISCVCALFQTRRFNIIS